MIPFFWLGPPRPPDEASGEARRSGSALGTSPRGASGLGRETAGVGRSATAFGLHERGGPRPEETGGSGDPSLNQE